jgi:thiol-disulfide isomerase/thioredoxin
MDSVGLLAVAAVLVIGVVVGLWRRRADGRLRPIQAQSEDHPMPAERLDDAMLATLGVAPAEATLLQFSSAFCAPCRAVRRVSSEVAAMLPGVQHVEVDAESHLDEVRALDIWRTPTLLILDGQGRVTKRATGVPTKPQLIAALGEVLPDRANSTRESHHGA